ncbi:MAG: hypothetical protein LH630_02295 [Actinomycetia bacterium]|nr:hypothetical protein [Actinomycetes bacterium]
MKNSRPGGGAPSQSPVSYQDRQGDWDKIDPTVVDSDESGFAWENRAGLVDTLFSKSLSDGGVQLRSGDTWVSFALAGAAAGEVVIEGNTIIYRDVFVGVDVAYQVLGQGVKETVILADPKTQRAFGFDISTSKGATVRTSDNGAVTVFDAEGESVFGFGEVFAEDSRGDTATTDGAEPAVTADLLTDGDTYRLDVKISDAWVDAPERAWPVMVDPTVTLTTTARFPPARRTTGIGPKARKTDRQHPATVAVPTRNHGPDSRRHPGTILTDRALPRMFEVPAPVHVAEHPRGVSAATQPARWPSTSGSSERLRA